MNCGQFGGTKTDLNRPLMYAMETAAEGGSFSPFRPINASGHVNEGRLRRPGECLVVIRNV